MAKPGSRSPKPSISRRSATAAKAGFSTCTTCRPRTRRRRRHSAESYDVNRRRRPRGHIGRSWYVDETYIKVHGQWRYLYRAIDRDGALVDVMLSERRDLAAAKAFFRTARIVTGVVPDRVTTDGHNAYPAAIRSELGEAARHRTNTYLNNVFDKRFLA